jgi:hypothetical protein
VPSVTFRPLVAQAGDPVTGGGTGADGGGAGAAVLGADELAGPAVGDELDDD